VTQTLNKQLQTELIRHSEQKLPTLRDLTQGNTPRILDESLAEIRHTDLCLRSVEDRERELKKRKTIRRPAEHNVNHVISFRSRKLKQEDILMKVYLSQFNKEK
jgi:hypothetical protein